MICKLCEEDRGLWNFELRGDVYKDTCFNCVSIERDVLDNYRGTENVTKLIKSACKCRAEYIRKGTGGY